MKDDILREIVQQVEAFVDNHKGRPLNLLDISKLMSILKPIYEERQRKQVKELKKKIEDDCAIKKYPNRSYDDYAKGKEAGYNWVLKIIDEVKAPKCVFKQA